MPSLFACTNEVIHVNVYALGIINEHDQFLVKRLYSNKEDAQSALRDLKGIVWEYSYCETEIREMPVFLEKETDYYIINANKTNAYIYEVAKAPITPARSYSSDNITFSLKNEGFLNESEIKAQAKLTANEFIMQIDSDLKKLVKDYVFVKPNLEHGRVISYDLKDGFDLAVDECHYPSIMEEALDEVVHLLSLKIENIPDWLMFISSKIPPQEQVHAVEKVLARHHLFDKDNNLAWLLYKVIDGEYPRYIDIPIL